MGSGCVVLLPVWCFVRTTVCRASLRLCTVSMLNSRFHTDPNSCIQKFENCVRMSGAVAWTQPTQPFNYADVLATSSIRGEGLGAPSATEGRL